MADCNSNALAENAACLACASPIELQGIRILLLCNILNGTPMNCDANTLMAAASAAGYTAMPPRQMDAVEVYLLCSLSNGSGSGFTFGNYGGGEPTFIPASGEGAAVDTSDGTKWYYYNGAWH